jgi:hypothetical protein
MIKKAFDLVVRGLKAKSPLLTKSRFRAVNVFWRSSVGYRGGKNQRWSGLLAEAAPEDVAAGGAERALPTMLGSTLSGSG